MPIASFLQEGLFADKLKQLKAEQGSDEMVSLLISFIEEGQDKSYVSPKNRRRPKDRR